MSQNSRVLIISDLHLPYHHANTLTYLEAIKKIFKPDRVILTGDEIDWHSISFHDKDPDLFSPSQELEEAKKYLKEVYGLFPKADVLESNHGSLVYRKGKYAGLPRYVFKGYNEILEAPKQWSWSMDLTIRFNDGRNCYLNHGKSANGLKLSQSMGMSVIQGHFHEKFDIQYWANSLDLYWAMTVGCMVDDKQLAFAYNKSNLKRPLIGCGIVLDGQPKLLPMILDSKGDWIRKIL